MPPPMIDPTDPEAIRRELFDENRWIKDQFAAHVGEALPELCEALASCFRLLPAFNDAASTAETKRTALVAAFVFGVLDDLVVSTKLLLAGNLPTAGNQMRQAVEGIAMAFLCSTEDLLIIETKTKNRPPVMARYWEKVWDEDRRTQGHLALRRLGWNAGALRVNADAVTRLGLAKKHYNGFSHCGTLTIASRVSLGEPGTVYLGGHFDPAKLDAYRVEMNERIGLCRVLPPFMERMLASMAPPAAGEAAPARA